jgi:hypothetical protein
MTEFKKLESAVDELQKALHELPADGSQARASGLSGIKAAFAADISAKLEKFVARANEADPEKKIYGPSMVTKVIVGVLAILLITRARTEQNRVACRFWSYPLVQTRSWTK